MLDEDILGINKTSNDENEVDDDEEIMSETEKVKPPRISKDGVFRNSTTINIEEKTLQMVTRFFFCYVMQNNLS